MADSFLRNVDRVKPAEELPLFLHDFRLHLWNSRDVERRPFGELLASEEARAGVEFDVRPSKYPGIRNGAGINLSGLRPMTEHWEAILADVDFVRTRFLARHRIKELNWFQLWQLTKTLFGMPSYMFARNGESETIPVRVSGMFRAVIGVASVVEGMLGQGVSPMGKAETAPILEHAEKGGFMSDGGRACAGPIHLVQQFTDVVIKGLPAKVPPAVEEMLGDVDLYLQYGEEGQRWDLANQLYRANCRLLAERSIAAFSRIGKNAIAADQPRAEAWAQIHRSAISHLDLGWFSIGQILSTEQVTAAIPLIEMFLGVEPPEPDPAAHVAVLSERVTALLPWAAPADAVELAGCWSSYVDIEQRLARVYYQIQETTPEPLRRFGARRSPLFGESGPRWPTSEDFTRRLGATVGDLFADAFRMRVTASESGVSIGSPETAIV
jgi:hypothetical protein